jgi:hypothetical protein
MLGPQGTVALAGASMGGLVSRYALAYMEKNGLPHPVRTYISFDSASLGADIPLGIQYWIKFFSTQASEAATLLAILDRPAARQMLVYHYSDPPGPTDRPIRCARDLRGRSRGPGGLAAAPAPRRDRQRQRQRERPGLRPRALSSSSGATAASSW